MSSGLIPAFLQYIGTNRNVKYVPEVPEYDRGVEVTAHSDSCTKLHVDTKRYWFVRFTQDNELRKRVVEGQTYAFPVASILDLQVILSKELRGNRRKIKESSNVIPERARPCPTGFFPDCCQVPREEGACWARFTAKSAGTELVSFCKIWLRQS